MDRNKIAESFKKFQSASYLEGKTEFWYGKDLMTLLGYTSSIEFQICIERAKLACRDAGAVVRHNFLPVWKNVRKNGKVVNAAVDMKLTRYACYLTALNSNTNIESVVFAQAFFSVAVNRLEEIYTAVASVEDKVRTINETASVSNELFVAPNDDDFQRGMDIRGIRRVNQGLKKRGAAFGRMGR